MDTKTIITLVLSVIASGIIAPFSKAIFDKIFASYSPKPEKIKKFFSNLTHIGFGYVLPIVLLVIEYYKKEQLDKPLVILTCLTTLLISVNLLLDVMKHVVLRWVSTILEVERKNTSINFETLSLIEKLAQQNTLNADMLSKLAELQDRHLELTKRVTNLLRKTTPEWK